jgi:hypothetical protein
LKIAAGTEGYSFALELPLQCKTVETISYLTSSELISALFINSLMRAYKTSVISYYRVNGPYGPRQEKILVTPSTENFLDFGTSVFIFVLVEIFA